MKTWSAVWVCISSSSSSDKPGSMYISGTGALVVVPGVGTVAQCRWFGAPISRFRLSRWQRLSINRTKSIHNSSVGLAGADGEFPVTRAATELMHACEETTHYVFPCFVAFSLSLFILVGLGSQCHRPVKTPDRAFWNAQIHATSANTDHL